LWIFDLQGFFACAPSMGAHYGCSHGTRSKWWFGSNQRAWLSGFTSNDCFGDHSLMTSPAWERDSRWVSWLLSMSDVSFCLPHVFTTCLGKCLIWFKVPV
jgi:hypothetical protein